MRGGGGRVELCQAGEAFVVENEDRLDHRSQKSVKMGQRKGTHQG